MADPIAGGAFFWLLYLQVAGGVRRFERAAAVPTERSSAWRAGLWAGVVSRCAVVLASGLLALDGSLLALALFSLVVARSAIEHGVDVGRGFGAGFESVTGRFPAHFAATAGLAAAVATRGLPLAAMIVRSRSA
jgi:hypothetical protein